MMARYKKQEGKQEFRRLRRSRGALLVGLALCLPAVARNPNDLLCFPSMQWYTLVNNNTPPVIDGNISGDPGWNGAFRYVFQNGTNTPDVIVQGVRDSGNTNLYISIQANNMMDWDPNNFVTLAFDPGGGAPQQALVIQPVPAGASSSAAQPPAQIKYYRGAYPFGAQAMPWMTAPMIMTGFATAGGSNYTWSMEARLPIDSTGMNGIDVPLSGNFGFYLDVVRLINATPADPAGSGSGAESIWPTDAPGLSCGSPSACEPAAALPMPSTWGNGTIGATSGCQGVSITTQMGPQASNIYTNQGMSVTGYGTEPAISLTNPNIFYAYVQNTMVNPTGNPVVATGITATFKIANFGLPSPDSWIVPGTEPMGSPIANDPIAGVSVPSSGVANSCQSGSNNMLPACIIHTGAWSLNAYEQGIYAGTHQCVQVTLDAPGPGSNVLFLNNTATQNMNFGSASVMQRTAEISAKGYALPPGMTDQVFDIGVMTKIGTLESRSDATQTNGVVSLLTWEAHGCRQTNNFVLVGKTKVQLCQNVGGFGYIVQHASATRITNWNQELTGPGLVKVKNNSNVYSVHVPQNGVVQVSTRIEPVEPGKGGIFGLGVGWWLLILAGLIVIAFLIYRLVK